jgi:hypothetical protein
MMADVLVHRDEEVARAGRAVAADELARPRGELAVGVVVVRAQVVLEVVALVERVRERVELGALRERQLEVVAVRVLDAKLQTISSVSLCVSGCTSATEFESGSWIIRTDASGATSRSVARTRWSWLSRGLNITRCSPKRTGWR